MDMNAETLEAARGLVALGPWLDRTQRAGLSIIPTYFSEPFPFDQVYSAMDGNSVPKELATAIDWAERWCLKKRIEQGERWMTRWECCAEGRKKYLATVGGGTAGGWGRVLVDDERILDCTVPDKNGMTRLCVRRWVQPSVVDGYPLEFRVFYDGDGLWAVSNYYPQRPLSGNQAVGVIRDKSCIQHEYVFAYVEDLARIALFAAQQLRTGQLEQLKRPFPVGCSMDFIVDEIGAVWFLEGGPPHWENPCSADPCCFAPGRIEAIGMGRSRGIALAAEPGSRGARTHEQESRWFADVATMRRERHGDE